MHRLPPTSRRLLPPLSALVAFEAAARHGSFTRAADELSLTQSAISRRINTLEEITSLKLFDRIRNNVVLTPVGTFYAEQIQEALKGLAAATQEASRFLGRGGVLRLGLPPTFGTRWLIPRIGMFLQEHRDIEIVFSTSLPGDAVFKNGTIDAIIHCGALDLAETVFDKLFDERLIVVAHPDRAAEITDPRHLLDETLLIHSLQPDAWSDWLDAQAMERRAGQSMLSFSLFSMVVEAAIDRLGVALVPEMLVESELASNRLVRLFNGAGVHARSLYLAYPPAMTSYPPLHSFRTWLLARCRESTALRTEAGVSEPVAPERRLRRAAMPARVPA